MAERIVADYDGPWKEALRRFFPAFLALLFPKVYADINWRRKFEFLDKELQKIVPDGQTGRRAVDVLVKVWRKGGSEQWVLIHIEVQAQPDSTFPERMYLYQVRLFDRYRRPVASFAVLADDRADWRPDQFGYELWDSSVQMRFPAVKLLDFAVREAELERSSNPFAVVVLAHLKAQETAGNTRHRYTWKLRLIKGLYTRGWGRDDVRQLVRLIDWFLQLPKAIELRVEKEIEAFEQEKQMPYVTSFERLGLERGKKQGMERGKKQGMKQGLEQGMERGEAIGLQTGIALALKAKFGSKSSGLIARVKRINDLEKLRDIAEKLATATTIDEARSVFVVGNRRKAAPGE
jgi:flagellar biosynthesis/type III secretory pathway protein FliH